MSYSVFHRNRLYHEVRVQGRHHSRYFWLWSLEPANRQLIHKGKKP